MVERSLHTATVLIKAAQADALWSLGCGDAIDDAKQAINRFARTMTATGSVQHIDLAEEYTLVSA